jgi:hypothetical protein
MFELDLWQSATGRASQRRQMHVGVGRRRPRKTSCGRPLLTTARAADEADLGADPTLLCANCHRALMATGPWKRQEDWVRPPAWVSDAPYIGSFVEAWRLNELTWRRAIALAQGQRQSRAAVANVLDVLEETRGDYPRAHVYRALGGVTMQLWAIAVVEGWWPPAGKEPVDDQASPAWWLAWSLVNFEQPVATSPTS